MPANPALGSSMVIGPARGRVPRAERRLAAGAFLSLFGLLGAQVLLETARDSLFLAHVPVARLPWMSLAMAGVSVLIARIVAGRGTGGPSLPLWAWMLAGAGVTAGLWPVLASAPHAGVYVLYLWTGGFSAWAVAEVWATLTDSLDISLAKRLYGPLAAGGGLGAVAGAAAARFAGGALGEPRHLVLAAAAVIAATALGPALALRSIAGAEIGGREGGAARAPGGAGGTVRVIEHPYVRRLLLSALLAAVVATLVDFSFKEAVVARVGAADLPRFFATFYLVTGLLSLLVQLFGIGPVVRTIGVGQTQRIFPALLLGGTAAVLASGGLVALVLLRGIDATLRNSFHRPAFELLQLPIPPGIRRRAKALIDVVAQRAGQALASVSLLLLIAAAARPELRLAIAAVALVLWGVVARGIKRRYVDLLRSALLARSPGPGASQIASEQLDQDARATLLGALESERTSAADLAAALEALADEALATGVPVRVPASLLAHPSPAVVTRALALLSPQQGGASAEVIAALDHLLAHGELAVRTAALRRRTALAPDRQLLRALAGDGSDPALRATALVELVGQRWLPASEARAELLALAAHPSAGARLALALALGERPAPAPAQLEEVLLVLARSSELEVLAPATAALGQLGAAGSSTAIAGLVALLAHRPARIAARAALAHAGEPAGAALVAALSDPAQPLPVRANVPRALVESDAESAGPALLDGLLLEQDGFVRFRILRALDRVKRARPDRALDEDILGRAAVAAVDSAYRYLAWRLALEGGARRRPSRQTATWQLVRELLREKEENAIERLFRVLALRYPREDFRQLLRALRRGGRRTRAAGRELIENLLVGPARTLTLALIDEVGDAARLATLSGGERLPQLTYEQLLREIRAEEQGGTLGALVDHHANELRGVLARDATGPHGRAKEVRSV